MSKAQAVAPTSQGDKLTLSPDDQEGIRQAFEVFDVNGTGRIDPKELKAAMQSLGYESSNPIIFRIFEDMDTPDFAERGGIEVEEFIEAINESLGNRETRDGLKRIFDMFANDASLITEKSLRMLLREIGDNRTSKEELNDILGRASSNGKDLNFEEFYAIMSKNSFK